MSDKTNGKSTAAMLPDAKLAVQNFVNAQGCLCNDDVLRALDALASMAFNASLVVKNGKSEKLS